MLLVLFVYGFDGNVSNRYNAVTFTMIKKDYFDGRLMDLYFMLCFMICLVVKKMHGFSPIWILLLLFV